MANKENRVISTCIVDGFMTGVKVKRDMDGLLPVKEIVESVVGAMIGEREAIEAERDCLENLNKRKASLNSISK